MAKTFAERVARDLEIQRIIGDFITDAPKNRNGWVFISPPMAKNFLIKILKMYPEVKS